MVAPARETKVWEEKKMLDFGSKLWEHKEESEKQPVTTRHGIQKVQNRLEPLSCRGKKSAPSFATPLPQLTTSQAIEVKA